MIEVGRRGRPASRSRTRPEYRGCAAAAVILALTAAAGAVDAEEPREDMTRFFWWGTSDAGADGSFRGRIEYNVSPRNPESSELMRVRLICEDTAPLLILHIFEPLATTRGVDGRVSFDVDGERFERHAIPDFWGYIGYLPLLHILPNDPLISALMKGTTLRLTVHGSANVGPGAETIPLDGTFKAFDEHLTPCLRASTP